MDKVVEILNMDRKSKPDPVSFIFKLVCRDNKEFVITKEVLHADTVEYFKNLKQYNNQCLSNRFKSRIKKLGPEKTKEFLERYPHRLEWCI